MIVPMILGIISSSMKKGGSFFTAIAGIMSALPLAPIGYFFIDNFLHHPERYGTTNWTAFLVLSLQFATLSLAMIDAIVLGGAFSKGPARTLVSVIVCIAVCSAFIFGLDVFNDSTNHVHFVLKDVMHVFDGLSKPV
ncbi:hypothetical protein [Fibrobacter sp. UWEL]|uniref:hypothetical protein n=1 Tax=Fibrobacter sp. UWEL TaxID=1896209 RepID=UPI00091C1D8E|nr:hypothetical protein [Fibrobacter sp. UWEL]SHK46138.1 hypothetical protein SAMN05720468_102124 [Fibrobacter sp. UWEL]